MKKQKIIFVAMFVLTIAAVMAFSPLRSVSQKQINQSGASIPEDVAKILKNSCTSCHDAGGGMAASVWSFSAWDTYKTKKQAKKSKAICDAMTNGSMPPSGTGQSKIPTKAQIEIVCKWADSLVIK
jgi:cytochrome c5